MQNHYRNKERQQIIRPELLSKSCLEILQHSCSKVFLYFKDFNSVNSAIGLHIAKVLVIFFF